MDVDPHSGDKETALFDFLIDLRCCNPINPVPTTEILIFFVTKN